MFTGKDTLGEIVGANLKRLRKEAGMTQEAMGKVLERGERDVRRYEKSCYKISIIQKYRDALHIQNISEFFLVRE